MHLVLFQPDIPQNAGTLMRLGACLGVPVDLIEPCGFVLDDRRLRRAVMDYTNHLELTRHASWEAFRRNKTGGRLVLVTTAAAQIYTSFEFARDDYILLGRESAGVPPDVHAVADARLRIPMRADTRSLNVAVSAAMVLGEALRQTRDFPGEDL